MGRLLLGHIVKMPAFPREFWLYTSFMFLVEFGCALLGAASPKLMEIAICQDYKLDRLPSMTADADCKSKEVQTQLAFVLTVVSTCSVLAGKHIQN